MNDSDMDALIRAWIAGQESDNRTSEKSEFWWAIEQVMEWVIPGEDHEQLWEFIQKAYPKDMSDRAFAILAAGPLEDLIAYYGPRYIDRIETLARQDPKFNHLLGGVWKNASSNDVWQRVEKVRNEVW